MCDKDIPFLQKGCNLNYAIKIKQKHNNVRLPDKMIKVWLLDADMNLVGRIMNMRTGKDGEIKVNIPGEAIYIHLPVIQQQDIKYKPKFMTRLLRLQYFILCLIVQVSLYSQNISAQELQLPCEDCCEIGMYISVLKGFDLENALIPTNFNVGSNPDDSTKELLLKTLHTGISIDGLIYDFDYSGLGMWGPMQRNFYNGLKVPDIMSNPSFQRDLLMNKVDIYHVIYSVNRASCEKMKVFWRKAIRRGKDFNVRIFNCHIVAAESLIDCLDEDTKVLEYFKKEEIESNRWGVVNFRKAYDHMVSSCGDQRGKAPRLEVYKSNLSRARLATDPAMEENIMSDDADEQDENCQCQPLYIDPCRPLIRLDLGSGSGIAYYSGTQLDIQLQSELPGKGYIKKYETTFSELTVDQQYPAQPQNKIKIRDDGTELSYKVVGGVDFNNLDLAAEANKILPPESYDIITCGHPQVRKTGQTPNLAQISKYLKKGGICSISFFEFDYEIRSIAIDFMKEFREIFQNVTVDIRESNFNFTYPPVSSYGDYVVTGYKKTSSQRMNALQGHEKNIIYPNPAINILNVDGLSESSKMEIYNMMGIKVKTTNIKTPSVNIEDLKPGMYVVKIIGEENSDTQLLKIER